MSDYLVGLDLGGSSVKGVAATRAGEVLRKHNLGFDQDAPLDFVRAVRETEVALRAQVGGTPLAVGFSAPGLAAPDGRSISFMPGRLQGLEGRRWAADLGRDDTVPVLNDAQAALMGEVWQGAAKGSRNVILLTLGTGVGGAAMVVGRLLRGAMGRAGHFGHMSLDSDGPPDICSMPGSLEWCMGNATIRERTGGRFKTTHDLVVSVAAGDAQASLWWLASVRRLAAAVASLINILDPDTVVIGGGIARAGEQLFHPLRSLVEAMEWQPGGSKARIVPAQLGEYAGALGAAWNAESARLERMST